MKLRFVLLTLVVGASLVAMSTAFAEIPFMRAQYRISDTVVLGDEFVWGENEWTYSGANAVQSYELGGNYLTTRAHIYEGHVLFGSDGYPIYERFRYMVCEVPKAALHTTPKWSTLNVDLDAGSLNCYTDGNICQWSEGGYPYDGTCEPHMFDGVISVSGIWDMAYISAEGTSNMRVDQKGVRLRLQNCQFATGNWMLSGGYSFGDVKVDFAASPYSTSYFQLWDCNNTN